MRLSLALVVVPLAAQPVVAGEIQIYEGMKLPSDQMSHPVLDRAVECGLDPEGIALTEEHFRTEPQTAEGKIALDGKVSELSKQAGFGSDLAASQVSSGFISNLLTARVLMTLAFPETAPAQGRTCLADWLLQQGFRTVTEAEALAIREARSD